MNALLRNSLEPVAKLSPHRLVRDVLATYVGDEEPMQRKHRLVRDLGLDRIEVVLVAIKLKELAQGEFEVTDFDTLETVGDLEDMVWAWAHGTAAREGRRFDSGIMLKREVVSGEER